MQECPIGLSNHATVALKGGINASLQADALTLFALILTAIRHVVILPRGATFTRTLISR